MIAHSCNPSTQKDEAGGLSQVQDHHELHNSSRQFNVVEVGEDEKEEGRKRNRKGKEGKKERREAISITA